MDRLVIGHGDHSALDRGGHPAEPEAEPPAPLLIQLVTGRKLPGAVDEERAEQGEKDCTDSVSGVIPPAGQDERSAENARGHGGVHQRSRGFVPAHGGPDDSWNASALPSITTRDDSRALRRGTPPRTRGRTRPPARVVQRITQRAIR